MNTLNFAHISSTIITFVHFTINPIKQIYYHLQARKDYFQKCDDAIKKWRSEGPKPLNNGGWDIDGKPLKYPNANNYNSGLYLFTDRNTITHLFKPNFLPPYNTKEKREIILNHLKESWDEKSLTWQPVKSIIETALERLKMRKEGKKRKVDEVEQSDHKKEETDKTPVSNMKVDGKKTNETNETEELNVDED